MARIGGGRNSQVYKLTCEDSALYTGKLYFRHPKDKRDRLHVEFTSLQFLWEHGIRAVPQPLTIDTEQGCAVYEYVRGQQIESIEITAADIDQAVQFLVKLKDLKTTPASRELPVASEACFSGQAIINNLELRFSKLAAVRENGQQYQALHNFLTNRLRPSMDIIISWVQAMINRVGITIETKLPRTARTLSPSDFGFHNALRRQNGGTDQIVFLDFEYFGWDDPAKMVSDFVQHPGRNLTVELKQKFIATLLPYFDDDRQLAQRIGLVHPLFGLKWCLILLNEFIPQDLERRGFARRDNLDQIQVQTKQLAKAEIMLDGIMSNYEQFPYYN